jgi:TIR domain
MRIFLSYRREDSAAWAGRLHDSLAAQFGEENIFQDVVAVRPGQDFGAAIQHALDGSDAALAVIGPRWLTVTGPSGTTRLEEPADHVRAELAAALDHEILLIPVLVGGATMPRPSELPPGLEPLAQRQAVTLDDTTWRQDVDGLVAALRGESPRGRGRLPWWLAVAGLVLVAVVAVVLASLLLDDGDGSGDDESVTGCWSTTTPGWVELDLDGTPVRRVTGPDWVWSFAVERGSQRRTDDGWDVALWVKATNESGPAQEHEPRYELVVDGVEFPPYCFDVVGNAELEPGSSDVALVGFGEVARDPGTGILALDIEMGEDPVRIPLGPPSE